MTIKENKFKAEIWITSKEHNRADTLAKELGKLLDQMTFPFWVTIDSIVVVKQ
ncbi:MAG TPA: hypothetical protein VEP90_10450 [Methylomirabilota bacterium]|nr:hypothetical protein [Methylomirabilota bacterium]